MKRRAQVIWAGAGLMALAVLGAATVARTRPSPVGEAVGTGRVAGPVAARHVTINVSGMYCKSCEASVRTMLAHTAGVISTQVDVDKGLATVSYDANATSPAKLAAVINSLGYKASVPPSQTNGVAGPA